MPCCHVLVTPSRPGKWLGALIGEVNLKRLLVAYDFSEDSKLALSRCTHLCRSLPFSDGVAAYALHSPTRGSLGAHKSVANRGIQFDLISIMTGAGRWSEVAYCLLDDRRWNYRRASCGNLRIDRLAGDSFGHAGQGGRAMAWLG